MCALQQIHLEGNRLNDANGGKAQETILGEIVVHALESPWLNWMLLSKIKGLQRWIPQKTDTTDMRGRTHNAVFLCAHLSGFTTEKGKVLESS